MNDYTITTKPPWYITPNYCITFSKDQKEIGKLDFNGPAMTFEGNAEESAKKFFDFIAHSFSDRLNKEKEAVEADLRGMTKSRDFEQQRAEAAERGKNEMIHRYMTVCRELDLVKKDASRYRLMRLLPGNDALLQKLEEISIDPMTPEQFDAVIDTVMEKNNVG